MDHAPRRSGPARLPLVIGSLLSWVCLSFHPTEPFEIRKLNGPLISEVTESVGEIYAISGDGSVVAHAGVPSVAGLAVVSTDGTASPARVSDFELILDVLLTQDGSDVLFRGRPVATAGDALLCSAPSDGSGPHVDLLPGGNVFDDYRLSPDGSWVVFRGELAPDVIELYVAPTDGSVAATKISAPPALGFHVLSFELGDAGVRAVYGVGSLTDGVEELYSVHLDGTQSAVRLNGPVFPGGLVADYEVSPDGARVAYAAAQDSAAVELYSAPIDGTTAAVKVSGPMTAGGGVMLAQITPDGSTAVYRADQHTDQVFELYAAPLDGSSASVRVNPPLGGGRDVSTEFLLTSDSTRVVYRADQNVNNVQELFVAPLDGSQASTRLSGSMVSGGDVSSFQGGTVGFGIAADDSRAFYLADQFIDNVVELFSVPLDGSQAAVRLNAPLATSSQRVEHWDLTSDGQSVAFQANQDFPSGTELFLVPADGSGPPVLQSTPYPGGTDVTSFDVRGVGDVAVYRAREGAVYKLHAKALSSPSPAIVISDVPREVLGTVRRWLVAPDQRHVVYVAQLEGDEQESLYAGRLDGPGDVIRLSDPSPTARPWGEVVSPDGEWAVFRMGQSAVSGAPLFSRRIAGGGSIELGDPGGTLGHIVTPDSQAVVYLHRAGPTADVRLFSTAIDGSDTPTLLSGAAVGNGDVQETGLATAGGGSHVVFLGDLDVNGKVEIYSAPVDGSEPRTKLNAPMTPDADVLGDVLVTPDGNRIVWRADNEDGGFELYSAVLGVAGSGVRLSDTAATLDGAHEGIELTPDGSQVLYRWRQPVGSVDDLFVVPVDGSGPPVKLNGGGSVTAFEVTSGGARVAYIANESVSSKYELYSVEFAVPGASIKLSAPLPFGSNVTTLLASPDGSRVAYRADPVRSDHDLFCTPSDGSGGPVRLNDPLDPGRSVGSDFRFAGDEHVLFRASYEDLYRLELYIVSVRGGTNVRVNAPLPDGYALVTRFAWLPKLSSAIYYQRSVSTVGPLELFQADFPRRLPGPGVSGAGGGQSRPAVQRP